MGAVEGPVKIVSGGPRDTGPALKIVSGGQTGVDQGALAGALAAGAECGGWCPEGRRSEEGPIPTKYPVAELPGAGYRERTLRNVLDSDGTLIIHDGELEGGTRLTWVFCEQHGRPSLLIDASSLSPERAADALIEFVTANGLTVLNVAGPRASKWPEAFGYTKAVVTAALKRLTEPSRL